MPTSTPTIAITGASGKLGGAVLSALLEHNLHPPTSIIALTSSPDPDPASERWSALAAKGVRVRHASFDDPPSFEKALRGVDRFLLVSTPRIDLDFDDAPEGRGREAHHRVAIDAAVKSGVRHLFYSSLAFGFSSSGSGGNGASDHSKAGVMRAHLRTEAYLRELTSSSSSPSRDRDGGGKMMKVTVLREGLYNESWPLYLGYYGIRGGDERDVVRLAGDGRICWTAIWDLGVANALVLVADGEAYAGRTLYLSTRPEGARSLREIAAMVGRARGREVGVEIVGREGHVRHYVDEKGMGRPAVEWWVGTYEALEDGECLVDDPTLEGLLRKVGLEPTPVEETVAAMVKG